MLEMALRTTIEAIASTVLVVCALGILYHTEKEHPLSWKYVTA